MGTIGKNIKNDAPLIYVTVGVSGSGKSKFAEYFCGDYVKNLCLDEYRKKVFGDVNHQDSFPEVLKARDKDLVAFLAGSYDVMLSDTNLDASRINSLAKKYPYNEIVVFFLKDSEDKELCKQRIKSDLDNNTDRADVPEDVIDRQYERFMKMKSASFEDNVICYEVDKNFQMKKM